jgi:hypothetical protein
VPVAADLPVASMDVASDGENLLAVFEAGGEIRGMLVDGAGHPVWPKTAYLVPSSETSSSYQPSVAFGGGHYLVVWQSEGVWFRQFGADGTAEGDPEQLSAQGYYPSAAWLGDEFALTWLDFDDAGAELALATLDASGVVSPTRLLTDDGTVTTPRVAASASGALVTWPSEGGLDALLLDGAAEVQVPRFLLASASNAGSPETVSDGTGYLVAYEESTTSAQLMAVAVTAAGVPSAPALIAEAQSLGPISLAANATDYVVVWKDYTPVESDELDYRHVSSTGVPGAGGLLTSYPTTSTLSPFLLGRDSGYWVAYQDGALYGTFTDDDLTPQGDAAALTLAQNSEDGATLSWDGSHYVLVWGDERDGGSTYRGQSVRINTAGRVLDPEPLEVSESGNRGFGYAAASSGQGTSLVTWVGSDTKDVYFRTLYEDGTESETMAADVSVYTSRSTVASDGTGYYAAYSGSEQGQFLGQRFDADATPLGPPFALSLPTDTQEARVMAGAEGYLLVIAQPGGTYLAELDAEGNVTEPRPLGMGSFPSEAISGGGKTAIVWTGPSSRLARFWGGGDFTSDEFTLADAGMWGQTIWDRDQFAAVWQDADYHSHWTTFDLDGNLSPAEDLFADEECVGPKLVTNGAGQALLNCVRYDADYSRRLVNYLLGEPLPDLDPVTPAPEPEPVAPPDATVEPTAAADPEPSAAGGAAGAGPEAGGAASDVPIETSDDDTEPTPGSSASATDEPSDSPVEASPDAGADAAGDAGPGDRVEEQQLEGTTVPKGDLGFCSVAGLLGHSGDSRWWLFFALAPALWFARARRFGAR